MRQKLYEEMKQKVDDEDDRIAKAVAERETKRLVSRIELLSQQGWRHRGDKGL